ncbi:hypothetical protein E0H26_17430 [Micromonospora zingiberis]|uniref:Uncharacterized protein n=1 Tax=Micromonospora zingiberis TaxID=2053011 RepID=A0A4R0GI59_9ACTN|nr:hypothetical protein [Micromonospora zingiberis]TCB95943.1 hypothetical protein E0H26_17430 [Micromonospora zingiberis]
MAIGALLFARRSAVNDRPPPGPADTIKPPFALLQSTHWLWVENVAWIEAEQRKALEMSVPADRPAWTSDQVDVGHRLQDGPGAVGAAGSTQRRPVPQQNAPH